MVVKPQIDRFDQYIPYPQNLKLLLRATDATTSGMKDFSGYGRVVTNSTGATGSTTQKKVNPYSMYFDGTDDVISIPDSTDFAFGAVNWTYSFWIYPLALPTSTDSIMIISQYVDANNYQYIHLYGDGTIYYINRSSSTTITEFHATHGMTINNWYHLSVCRSESNPRIYINGISLSVTEDTTISGKTLGDISSVLYVGANNTTGFSNVYLDCINIWKGVAVPIEDLYPQPKSFSFRRA